MITATGCGVELEIFDYNFTRQTASTVQRGDWYQIKENISGVDMWDGNKKMKCGSTTDSLKYIRLCDDCARKEGLKW